MSAAERKTRIAAAKAELKQLKDELQAVRNSRAVDSLHSIAAKQGVSADRVAKLSERKRLYGHYGKVYAMAWAGDSEQVVSASQDGKLMLWNATLAARTAAIHLKSAWVMTCAFETKENTIVAAGGLDNVCSLYTVSAATSGNDKPICELAQHDGYLACCEFIGPDKILTSSGDSTCIMWDINSGAAEAVMSDHAGDVMSVAVCPTNPAVFVSGSCDATAKMWDLRTRSAVHTFSGHESDINTVQWMSTGYSFGTGSDDTQCKIFDTRAHFPVAEFADNSALASIISLDFSQSGRLLFAGNDNSGCVVWDTLGSPVAPVDVLMSHTNRVSSVRTAPSGQALGTASWDTTLIVYA